MAKCKHCGAKVGFLLDVCPSCLAERQESETNVAQQETPATNGGDISQRATGQERHAESLATIQSKYDAARGVSGVGEILGWLLVVLGIFLVLTAVYNETGVTGFIAAASICIVGLYLVMMAQFIRATVDNADTNREILRFLQTKK